PLTADGARVEALLTWRESVSSAVAARRGAKLSEDISIPVDRLGEAIERAVEIGRRHELEACSWGHAGDGNIHASFLVSPEHPDELRRAHRAAVELFDLAIALEGSISGEHGLGVLKNGHLRRQWAPRAVALHGQVKSIFDPKGLLNPGKKLP
ncbi:MAG TPA: FAD-linked oxidase C-terminal domain-containing protein, partial [Capillimicrobium sp.]|nr:FAD-linked oxidase C-terminal domain-containing protein [Capillimicrobium sp.]